MNITPLFLTLSSAGLFCLALGEEATAAQSGPGAAKNEVTIGVKAEFRTIVSNGWPDHAPGAFPRRGNPNTATPQRYEFRVPVQPEAQANPVRSGGYWWGVAVNGVPFEPGTAETWQNDRSSGWRYEAATGFLDLGLDEHHAHVQPTGAYHYHAMPTGLVERLGGDDKEMRLIGWAADGFPLYTHTAPTDPQNLSSPLKKLHSSYQLKAGVRPDGPGGGHDGRFTADFEYVKGSGDLDECNGRTGVTPEFPDGTYYYCVTEQFPFLPRFWRGLPDESFAKGGPPPGGGPGGRRPFGGPGPDGPPGFPMPPLWKVLDKNGDGALDAAEIGQAPAALRTLDANQDGRLSRGEYQPPPPSQRPPDGPIPPAPPQGAPRPE
jgi:hypothetical protein